MSDDELELVNYAKVAQQVRALQPRALTAENVDDVLTIITWMQGEMISMDDELTRRKAALDEREKALKNREDACSQREKDIALRARTFMLATSIRPRRRGLLGRMLPPW